ncbi:sperm-associated antigen 8 isoform X1 [Engystomops pustulosus]|uniref:sperm-associated antigen 8 isoform X1 n=1 Tax=Engystomops pustulosus TaxID=76066 RepID=UPI003AFB48A5
MELTTGEQSRVAPWQEAGASPGPVGASSALGTIMEGQGHKGTISAEPGAGRSTTHQDMGVREEKLRKSLYHKFSQEILAELMSPAEETLVAESTTKRDYEAAGFIPRIPENRNTGDYHSEQAVTFWTDNVHHITGVSDIRTRDSPFKRSSAFSTPMSDYLDQSLPRCMENYPNM